MYLPNAESNFAIIRLVYDPVIFGRIIELHYLPPLRGSAASTSFEFHTRGISLLPGVGDPVFPLLPDIIPVFHVQFVARRARERSVRFVIV